MNNLILLLQAKLHEARSRRSLNADIDRIRKTLDPLDIPARIDPGDLSDLRDLNTQMAALQSGGASDGLKKTEASTRTLGRLWASLKGQMAQAAQGFRQWLSVDTAVSSLIANIRTAVNELKTIDGMLTDIRRTAGDLTDSDLEAIGRNAFDTAARYGQKTADYLSSVRELYHAGYKNAEAMAELSALAQAAGGMDASLANGFLMAADAAYGLKGNTEALSGVLDGQNRIAVRNSLSLKDLTQATREAASQSAASGIAADKATAAMGTMTAATRQGGEAAARAWKDILLYTRQAQGAAADGGTIGTEALRRYESACNDLGVSLREIRNGAASLRDPMKILEELSIAYNSLDKTDERRTGLLDAAGGGDTAGQLKALLENWSLYEKMLDDYAHGGGSAMETAMQAADSWEGSLNRLGSTFTKVVGSLVDSDAVTAAANSLSALLSVVEKITSKLGSLGTIGLGAGILAGARNTGKPMPAHGFQHNCFEYALPAQVTRGQPTGSKGRNVWVPSAHGVP